MAIDVLYAIILAFAFYKGFTRGLIVAVFSLVAFVLGLAAALKLSAVLASWLEQSGMQGRWWPVLCFIVIFLAVVILVRLGAAFLEKIVQWSMLGWLNRLGGILLYIAIYTVIYSIMLWIANQVYWLSPEVKLQSFIYPYIEPIGPKVMDMMGKIIPVFKDMFSELERFFEHAAKELPTQRPHL